MVVIDTSAWIEYFKNGRQTVVKNVDYCLERNLVGIGDLIYCEAIQGIKSRNERTKISNLLLSLPRFNMVGFEIAEKSAFNYRFLRSQGITIRKTIDVIIGTFCAENKFQLAHYDKDFDRMASYIGLDVFNL